MQNMKVMDTEVIELVKTLHDKDMEKQFMRKHVYRVNQFRLEYHGSDVKIYIDPYYFSTIKFSELVKMIYINRGAHIGLIKIMNLLHDAFYEIIGLRYIE